MNATLTCRRCSECTGEPHHWLIDAADCDETTGTITIPCKHCQATVEGVICEQCMEIFPVTDCTMQESDEGETIYTCAGCTELPPPVRSTP